MELLCSILHDLLQGAKLSKIQESTDGALYSTIPKTLANSKAWKKGDEVAFFIVGDGIVPQAGDIILRKVRSS